MVLFYIIKNLLFKEKLNYFGVVVQYNYTLISTSTPLGNSSFIKASMVLEDEL